jgi:prolyl oligopeptidase
MRVLCVCLCSAALMSGQAPVTKVQPVTDVLHGVSIADPYRWLEDQNSADTRAWVEAQMSYTEGALAKIPQRNRIRRRLGELVKVDVMNPPSERGGRYFFTKRKAGESQFVLYMRRGGSLQDTVLIDPNPLSADHSTSVVVQDISLDGKLLAYGLRQGGQDETTLAFRDVDAGKDLPDSFPPARYFSVALKPDKTGFYYMKMLEAGPRLYYHAMGAAPSNDRIIFAEQFGPSQLGGCRISDNGRWLTCQIYTGASGDKVDIYVQDLSSGGTMQPFAVGLDSGFQLEVAGNRLYMMTNWKAPNWRILRADLTNPARENWKEIIPERKTVMDSFNLAGGKIAVSWLENVHSKLEVFTEDGKLAREIKLPSIGVATGPFGRWESNEAFYTFNSIAQPNTIYRYDMATGVQSVWFQVKQPFDPATIELKQVWYTSRDGTRVPMFITAKKGTKLDGSHPTILYGYGGFNLSQLPSSSSTALTWIEMGGVYAVANLRGGAEFGEEWHKAGMLEKKQNVFDDFIAAAEYLTREKYTRADKLAIWGGSNGGLLVGAALTQHPELFQAVICGAPLLDMVRYDKFKVAKFWVPEYGTADDPGQFTYLYKYSPYHHVDKGAKYPAVMLVTGDSDTRVDPLHARKMAALLQASTASDRPILLNYDTKAGHSGGLPVDRQVEIGGDELAFLAWQLGMTNPSQ